ncbi:acyltransferase family protein [Mameliella sediminis]|uniref:acyltransferase family protein n=1 Tax=Mameliella sediminis TaxID=2836866 RepID=UPI0024848221|nr:acyltransferase [Mameliella sediminis]
MYRAVAIGFVVLGHWMMVAPVYSDGAVSLANILAEDPWTQYLTWLFQVMPVFFFVGGFSNAISWTSARQDPERRRIWAATRLARLLKPTVPLILLWALAGFVAKLAGVPRELIDPASQAALVPVWFLAVYIVITVAVPVTAWVWDRIGPVSVLVLMLGAIAVDAIAFGMDMGWLRWANYGFVWLAVHQMGFWWQDRDRWQPPWPLVSAFGLIWMLILVVGLGFPLALISVPGEDISNTRPPTTAMLAIGLLHIGFLIGILPLVRRALENRRLWAAVILVNQMIMTVYLWHLTAVIVLLGLSMAAGGLGMGIAPGTPLWWLLRPVWVICLVLALLPFVLMFFRFEAGGKSTTRALPGHVQAMLGALMTCAGMIRLALNGIGSGFAPGFDGFAVALVIAGALVATRRFGAP